MLKRFLIAMAVTAVVVPAATSEAKRPPAPAAWKFDATGWKLLGSQTVQGKRDKDTIVVGKYEGKFDQLVLVVEDSDIELKDITVIFGNRETFSPKTGHYFKEGARSRVIDLPGSDRFIKSIALSYANLPGGGKATVSVYGRDSKARPSQPSAPQPPPPPPPAPYKFDSKGWTMLGGGKATGKADSAVLKLRGGKWDQITMVVTDSDLELKNLEIVFGNNDKWSPRVQHVFRENSRTRVIDLPGRDRNINRIDISYANIPGGGNASVEFYGRNNPDRKPPPKIVKVKWENKGWKLLGTTTATGWRDRDTLAVKKNKGISELMFVVAGSDLALNGIVVTFGNGETYNMQGSATFKEGARTAPVDLPGALRQVKSIDFAYGNLPGGGQAQVQVWGRIKPGTQAQPQPPAGGPPTAPPPPPGGPIIRDHRK